MTGFIILIILFLIGILIYVEMAKFPGHKARARGHPQADAINVLSWVGLLLGVVPWVVALVWAYTDLRGPTSPSVAPEEESGDSG
ncbi:MAG: DUF3302 domain-containing protein [Thermoanaerobaculia bacterium]